ncbi:MAG: tetratricopeptide repeat protein [Clostridium sp.]|nr:tetratricopeptide repeat protein [Clostridium sp.]
MIRTEEIRRISNSFYNEGLRLANIRDLTGAAGMLKTCLNLNKFHTEARNLLGLVYMEMGETGDALMHWVISTNFQEKNNRASVYLERVQNRQEVLDEWNADIRRYNSALSQAKIGNPDLAAVQLSSVADGRDNFVKAQNLMALLCIQRGEYAKAGRYLLRTLRVDAGNPKAQWYLAHIRSSMGRDGEETETGTNTFSHRRMKADDVIIPPTYRENTGRQSVLLIIAGLLLGACAVFFLVMPTRIRQETGKHTRELLSYNEQLNQKNEEIAELEKTSARYLEDKDKAESELNNILNNKDSAISQYGTLLRMNNAYRSGDLGTAASLYKDFDTSLIADDEIRQYAENLRQEVATEGYQSLEDEAYETWNSGRFREAIALYETCLTIRPENPKVLYYLGILHKSVDEIDTAVQYFTRVVTEFAASEQASPARTQLEELSPSAGPRTGTPVPESVPPEENGGQGSEENGEEAGGQDNGEAEPENEEEAAG